MREVAKKVRVVDLIGGIFRQGEKENKEPSYLITPQKIKVSRVNIVGTVVEKYISETQSYAYIVVNDLTESIRVKFFGDDLKLIEDINIGDIVTVIGKVREYNGEIYIAAEACAKTDIKTELRRKKEVIEFLSSIPKEDKKEENMEEYKQTVLRFLREMDDGNGVEIGKIIDMLNLPLQILDRVITELLDEKKIIEVLPLVYKINK